MYNSGIDLQPRLDVLMCLKTNYNIRTVTKYDKFESATHGYNHYL